MERCLAGIITRHSPRFYAGFRNGTRNLSSTSPLYAQVKASLAGNKAGPDTNYQMKTALSNATTKSQFRGDIIIEQSKGDAIAKAVEASSKSFADSQRIALFVDGSLVWKPNGMSDSIGHLGAAIVYKSPEGSQDWQVKRYFALSKARNSESAEVSAITQAAAVAIELIKRMKRQKDRGSEKITVINKVSIFTDSQSTLTQVDRLRRARPAVKAKVCSDPNICKLIMRSQYLHKIGVRLELCWVPGHSGVVGHDIADREAGMATKTQPITVTIGEIPRWIELEATSED